MNFKKKHLELIKRLQPTFWICQKVRIQSGIKTREKNLKKIFLRPVEVVKRDQTAETDTDQDHNIIVILYPDKGTHFSHTKRKDEILLLLRQL